MFIGDSLVGLFRGGVFPPVTNAFKIFGQAESGFRDFSGKKFGAGTSFFAEASEDANAKKPSSWRGDEGNTNQIDCRLNDQPDKQTKTSDGASADVIDDTNILDKRRISFMSKYDIIRQTLPFHWPRLCVRDKISPNRLRSASKRLHYCIYIIGNNIEVEKMNNCMAHINFIAPAASLSDALLCPDFVPACANEVSASKQASKQAWRHVA